MTVSLSKFGSLAREPTPEEKQESDRRRTAIRSGRHPDTGAKLQLRDRRTVRPFEIMEVQSYFDAKTYRHGVGYMDPVQRAMIELEESRWAEAEKWNAISRTQHHQTVLNAQTAWALRPSLSGIDTE